MNQRDFVGYGATPPHPGWPGGARLAINFVVNVEEGSEYSIADGDGFSEGRGTETGSVLPRGVHDLAVESMFEYGSRVGYWRIRRLFKERNIPFTAFACALALERNPDIAQSIKEDGYDLCCHGWRWVSHAQMSVAEESEEIAKAVASLTRMFGAPPPGWYCRYGPSPNTRRLIVAAGGFTYDSDSYNDELPYWVLVDGKPHLVVPYSLAINDGKFHAGMTTANQFFEFLRDSFDMLYREGETQPKMMSVGLHLRIIGHPGRAAALERFLDYVAAKPDVWIAPRVEIARHWQGSHPFAA